MVPSQALVANGFPFGTVLADGIASMRHVLHRYPAS